MSDYTSKHIKHAVMSYFRFQRQMLCASECLCMDVCAISDKDVHEVEVKISKSDLWNGEKRKFKHSDYKLSVGGHRYAPTKFSIAVPEELLLEAKLWVSKTNPKYGIIFCRGGRVFIDKSAERLRDSFNENFPRRVMMRVCSENIGHLGRVVSHDPK